MNNIESQHIEFKSSWRDEYLKVISAFANIEGGKLIIGIDDKGKIIGIKNTKRLLLDIPNKVRNILGVIPNVKVENKNKKEIIIIEIKPSSVPISYEGKFYERSGSTNLELKGKELTRFLISKADKDWDEFIEERFTTDDIDIATIEKFKELAVKRLPFVKEEKDHVKLLEKLNLTEDGKFKRAAVLLFSKNPKKYFTSAYIKVGKFLTDTDIISSDDVEGNLFQQVERTMELLRTKYLISKIKFEGIYRKEELEYPEEALREAIINAVIHRDYIGPHTQLKIYSDRIILWNVGILPKQIKIEDLKRSHASYPRNELLADIFFKAGLIETWGRGTIKITDECKKAGLPEPEFKQEFGGFSIYFYKDIYTEENLRKMGLNERQIKGVMYVKEKETITNREFREMVGVTDRTVIRDLNNLCERGMLKKMGETGRGTVYTLTRQTGHQPDKNPTKGNK